MESRRDCVWVGCLKQPLGVLVVGKVGWSSMALESVLEESEKRYCSSVANKNCSVCIAVVSADQDTGALAAKEFGPRS